MKKTDTILLQNLHPMQDRKNRVAIVEICLFVFMKGRKKYIILKEGRADVTEGEVQEIDKEVRKDQGIQYILFPEKFTHIKSYITSGIKYINTGYLPVESRRI